MNHRPPIPELVKREVRQRCRFGCVLCGCPVYHYDHIIEYSEERVHEVDNLALLCGTHHDQKTRRQLPAQMVRAALDRIIETRKRPQEGSAELFFDSDITVTIGGNELRMLVVPDRPLVPALVVDDTVLLGLRLEDGLPLLTVRSFDERNNPVLWVKDNELRHTDQLFDISYVGTTLTFRRALGDILLEIDFAAPDRIKFLRGAMYAHGVGLEVRRDALVLMNNRMGLRRTRIDRRGIRFADAETTNELICMDIVGINRYQYAPAPDAVRKQAR